MIEDEAGAPTRVALADELLCRGGSNQEIIVDELNTPRTKILAELVVIVPTYREVDNLP